jgi:predicted NBD/HSP70 family sugar kinase
MAQSAEQVIGLDLGGTKLLGGAFALDGTVKAELNWPTETTSTEALIGQITEMVETLRDAQAVR